jgi:hypothetical protein
VVIDELAEAKNDIILNTVLRIKQAGVREPSHIADLLQLSDGLIRSLLDTAQQLGMSAVSESLIEARRSRVGWIYRDHDTGELWPELGEQIAPTELRHLRENRFQFRIGTAGNPRTVEALHLATEQNDVVEPSPHELMKSSGPRVSTERAAVISRGEPCLVISPIIRDKTGLAVLTPLETPHLSLGRKLNDELSVLPVQWLDKIPLQETPVSESRLAAAVQQLRHLQNTPISTTADGAFIDLEEQVELVLQRWIDYYVDLVGPSGDRDESTVVANSIADQFPLDASILIEWASLENYDARRRAFRILMRAVHAPSQMLHRFSVAMGAYDGYLRGQKTSQALARLAMAVLNLSQELLDGTGESDG